VKSILVIGAGTMGRGISKLFILKGYAVALYDSAAGAAEGAKAKIRDEFYRRAEKAQMLKIDADQMLGNLAIVTDLKGLQPHVAIEAIIEDFAAKVSVLKQLQSALPRTTILASNTSSLSISSLAGTLENPGRFLGLHFFNPAPTMPLVEIIPGARTEPDIIEAVKSEVSALGKTGIVARDSPGFVVNRVARPFYLESLRLAEEGASAFESTDRLCRSAGFKMGPFELMDMIGIDINYSVSQSIFNSFHQEPRFRPSVLQKQKVEAGELGRKSGKGFYRHS
jgi:3-hydroxybutyryl-CoA dehydrogenase